MSYNVRVIGADETATTAGAKVELAVMAGRGKMFTVSAYNAHTETLYLQAFDAATAPADGETTYPKLVTPVFAGLSGGFNFSDGALFTKGIYLCWSTTPTFKTVTQSDSGIIDATFRRQ